MPVAPPLMLGIGLHARFGHQPGPRHITFVGGNMNGSDGTANVATPWHVWIVGVVALLWNSIGAFDYAMTEMRVSSYTSAFTAEQIAYFYGFPKWAIATWALGVWGGVLGSLALLLLKRWAVPIFAISLVAMTITFFYNFAISNGIAVMGGNEALLFPAVIFVIGIVLLVYSRGLARKGILR
jgi:hypothetical protein